MKALFIYNQYSSEDKEIVKRVEEELSSYIEVVEINQASPELKNIIRETPAIIPVVDDLQGMYIKGKDVNGQLIVIAAIYKWMEKEEEVVHNQKIARLDNFVNNEKTKAIDDYTEELITGGVI